MMTSPYEWKILEWDDKPQTSKSYTCMIKCMKSSGNSYWEYILQWLTVNTYILGILFMIYTFVNIINAYLSWSNLWTLFLLSRLTELSFFANSRIDWICIYGELRYFYNAYTFYCILEFNFYTDIPTTTLEIHTNIQTNAFQWTNTYLMAIFFLSIKIISYE